MHYLFVGEDAFEKDAKIEELKRSFFSSPQASQFDYEVLHAHKLQTADLRKALLALPALSSKRLVVIRNCQKLSPSNKKVIVNFLGESVDCEIVLDYFSFDWKSRFFENIRPYVKVFRFGEGEAVNTFRLLDVIMAGQKGKAVEVLSRLLSQGEHPLQVLGGMVALWRRKKNWMPYQRFEEGLRILQEADLNIKRSRMRPEYALEMAVVKLCG